MLPSWSMPKISGILSPIFIFLSFNVLANIMKKRLRDLLTCRKNARTESENFINNCYSLPVHFLGFLRLLAFESAMAVSAHIFSEAIHFTSTEYPSWTNSFALDKAFCNSVREEDKRSTNIAWGWKTLWNTFRKEAYNCLCYRVLRDSFLCSFIGSSFNLAVEELVCFSIFFIIIYFKLNFLLKKLYFCKHKHWMCGLTLRIA